MSRLKNLPDTPLPDVRELDLEAARLARVEAAISLVKARSKATVAKIKEREAQQLKPLKALQARLTRRVAAFIEKHWSQVCKGKKSLSLATGTAGVRDQQGELQLLGATPEEQEATRDRAIAWLEEHEPQCVRVTKEILKNEVKKLDEKSWRKWFVVIGRRKDQGYFSPDKKRVAEIAATAAKRLEERKRPA